MRNDTTSSNSAYGGTTKTTDSDTAKVDEILVYTGFFSDSSPRNLQHLFTVGPPQQTQASLASFQDETSKASVQFLHPTYLSWHPKVSNTVSRRCQLGTGPSRWCKHVPITCVRIVISVQPRHKGKLSLHRTACYPFRKGCVGIPFSFLFHRTDDENGISSGARGMDVKVMTTVPSPSSSSDEFMMDCLWLGEFASEKSLSMMLDIGVCTSVRSTGLWSYGRPNLSCKEH